MEKSNLNASNIRFSIGNFKQCKILASIDGNLKKTILHYMGYGLGFLGFGLMNNNDIKKFYDSVAQETWDAWSNNNTLLPTIREFITLLPKHPRILDLGCGPGHESKRLYLDGANVVGIDFSTESVKVARTNISECTFYEQDFFSIDESLGLFDGIFSSGSLIHISTEKIKILLPKLTAILKPDRYFLAILQMGNKNFIHYPRVGKAKMKRVVYRFSEEEIIACFKSAGLSLFREAILASELKQNSWKAYIFKHEYTNLREKLELASDIRQARNDIKTGKVYTHRAVKEKLIDKFNK